MAVFLVYVPAASADLAESILKGAQSFLEAHGRVEREPLGKYVRTGRKKGSDELLVLVRFVTDAAADGATVRARARALEGVLRATLASTTAHAGDARVFVAEE